ncbi:MAG: hypothetical protein WCP39_07765, partial [Chlamydiota bacterium]
LIKQNFSFVETTETIDSYLCIEKKWPRFAEVCEESTGSGADLLDSGEGPFIRETIFSSHVEEDVVSSLQLIRKILIMHNFSYSVDLYNDKLFFPAILEREGISYKKKGKKEGFSGPLVEFAIEDGLKRKWVGPYVGMGCSLFGKRDLSYSKVEKKFSSMIERSLMGRIERFIALLLEAKEGKIPFWFAPWQVCITGKGKEKEALFFRCKEMGLRVVQGTTKREAVVSVLVEGKKILFFHEGRKEVIDLEECVKRLLNLQNQEKL